MQRAAKKDLNHISITDIIAELRDKYGLPINFKDTHQIKGFCDFVLTFGGIYKENAKKHGYPIRSIGKVLLVEVKSGNKDVTEAEEKYIKKCFGDYAVVHSFEELLIAMESICNDEDYYADGLMHCIKEIKQKYYNEMLSKAVPDDIKDPRNWK